MTALYLSIKSLCNRKTTAILTTASIAISVCLLLGVEKLQRASQESFLNTISGVDLIVGPRTGGVQLLLYSVFRIGDATNNISTNSADWVRGQADVDWVVPLSLGDSHKGYRVLGTTKDYFKHYRYAKTHALQFDKGHGFESVHDVVLGADVANNLGYEIGAELTLSHGVGEVVFQEHKDDHFNVVGILEKTGTPVDRSIHVGLGAIAAIHEDWQTEGESLPPSVTALLVGLKSKIGIFRLQREINEYPSEPLMAILPGVAFQQLWQTVGVVEKALRLISVFVVLAGLVGMLTSILTTLNERRREMAILRSIGTPPGFVFVLMLMESAVLVTAGSFLGVVSLYLGLWVAQPMIESQFGLFIPVGWLAPAELYILAAVIGAGIVIGAIPAWQAYRRSLLDGLTIKV